MSSHSKLCASCQAGTVSLQTTVDTDIESLPRWLRETDYVTEFITSYNCFRQNHPKNANATIRVQLDPSLAGRSVLFWGTKHSVGLKVPDAKSAYGSFHNSGVSYVKSDGSVVIKLACPSVYSVIPYQKQNPITFPRHCHWVVSNEQKTAWLHPVFTTHILCGSSKEQVQNAIQKQNALVVNALSKESHASMNIPSTNSIGDVYHMNAKNTCRTIHEIMVSQVPSLVRKAKQNNIAFSDLPIMLYCAHSECNAAKRLASHLMKSGFTNLYYYKDGVKGWYTSH